MARLALIPVPDRIRNLRKKLPLGANFHQDPEKFFRTDAQYKLNKRLYNKDIEAA